MRKPHINKDFDWTDRIAVINLVRSGAKPGLSVIKMYGDKNYKIINTKKEKRIKRKFKVFWRT